MVSLLIRRPGLPFPRALLTGLPLRGRGHDRCREVAGLMGG